MNKNSKIFITGHQGMVGSAIVRYLKKKNYKNLITINRKKLDLEDQLKVKKFIKKQKIEIVIHCAAKVGGIRSNSTYKADFISKNLSMQNNIIIGSYEAKIKRLIFLGSSCIYPRECPQPIKEEYFLSGKLEDTNRPYAIAKIAGVEMCKSFNEQYGTKYQSVMPSNLYGPNDNYDLNNSHFIPALIRKIYQAKVKKKKQIKLWGTGKPKREVTYVDDVADGVISLIKSKNKEFLINIGSGFEKTISEYAKIIANHLDYRGKVIFDQNRYLDGTPRKIVSSKKIKKLGWKAKTDFDKGLKIAINDFLVKNRP
ncbi:GDP-L-fucose synthase [Pelagibacterales bacterium SAG-MED10]|nr:GDP-L-fucose synthase [Pelagibacterales bacterium SAG-MED10]